MVRDMKEAKAWVDKQPCGPEKKKIFLNECREAFTVDGCNTIDEERIKDYFDALRRDPYVGLGI